MCKSVIVCVGILKEVLNRKKLGFDKVILSQRVLPFLLPLAIEPGLNENQVRYTTHNMVGYGMIMVFGLLFIV